MDWLLAPIDPTRAHDVGLLVSWHGRVMMLAWGVLAPLAVLIARYFKVTPGQDWPRQLDNQFWWRSHWMGHACVTGLSLVGLGLILAAARSGSLHGRFGYALLACLAVQVLLGIFRGSKGGPTAPAPDGSLHGDHYDMTSWRVVFEWIHKGLGYTSLALAMVVILMGLWAANALIWMWTAIALWWLALATVAMALQRRGFAVDTYQAIWGPDPAHPGNRRRPIGIGVRRMTEGAGDVRSH